MGQQESCAPALLPRAGNACVQPTRVRDVSGLHDLDRRRVSNGEALTQEAMLRALTKTRRTNAETACLQHAPTYAAWKATGVNARHLAFGGARTVPRPGGLGVATLVGAESASIVSKVEYMPSDSQYRAPKLCELC